MPILEWIAGGFILAGIWFYGRKRRAGPVCSMIGCLMWLCIGAYNHMWSLAVLNAILFATNTYNLVAWWQGQKHVEISEEEAKYRMGLPLSGLEANPSDVVYTKPQVIVGPFQYEAWKEKRRAAAQQRAAELIRAASYRPPGPTS